ncbi:hypothetical protein BDV25DRAFT_140287 [Aspergillus avenaceus]|uniref:PWI domain-containing protein n=1 Tax=Aspergillus avenaceus TaxID=36643 RepID=A0A5N6TUC2_ASPAV|nr:hypothetical protein BDV25DRAFT_140287 [Aspergillus avenaceus]
MSASVDAKLLRTTKFPPEFSRKVDMTKVNIEVMKKWIAGKISEILGNEDDVVIELCFNLLEGSRYPDVKSLQIQLTGFLDKDTAKFCKELWSLCLSAQENPQGVPKELLEAKKLELIQEKIEAEKAAEDARRQKEQERAREQVEDVVAAEVEALKGVIVSRTGLGGGSLTLTFPPVHAEAVALLDRPAALVLHLPLGHHPLDANALPAETGTGVAGHLAAPCPQTETGGRGDAALITVIELDPFPAVIHHAHVLPEETDGDGDPFLPAVHPAPLLPETGAERTLTLDLVLGRARKNRDDRRLSRSRDRDDRRRRRSSRSISRSRSRSRGRNRSRNSSASPRRHDSRSRSRSHTREKKRRRSIQRYAPAARRRRSTSSVSVRSEKRQRMTDQEDNSAKTPEKPNSSDHEMKDPEEQPDTHPTGFRTRISRTELREKLLREKLVAMRRTTSRDER